MKIKYSSILLFLTIFLSCSLNSEESEPQPTISLWHLIKVEGGLAGVDESYELETVVWFFDDDPLILEVDNSNTDDSKQDGFDSGSYSYNISNVNGEQFLIINGSELGRIQFLNNITMEIDENQKSDGQGADGFIYTFSRQVVAE